ARPPVYHWGDMDYGGIRICEYIRRNLIPDLQPYLMDVTTYTRYLPAGIPFGDEYAARLRHLAEDPAYAPWHPLLQAMLKHRKWVEQESIAINVSWA
ncbi:Wadjet anti-phage system protein JetD domain-containing protein, partial [Neomoorella thermoacetica]